MKTHNLAIYHCLACGAIMHCELERETPQCCGNPMVKSAAETVVESDRRSATASGRTSAGDKHSDVSTPKKPR